MQSERREVFMEKRGVEREAWNDKMNARKIPYEIDANLFFLSLLIPF